VLQDVPRKREFYTKIHKMWCCEPNEFSEINKESILQRVNSINVKLKLSSSNMNIHTSGFPNQNFVWISHLCHLCYMPHPSHPPGVHHPNNIWWKIQIMEFFIMHFLHPPVTSSLFSPNILLCTVLRHPQSVFFPECERSYSYTVFILFNVDIMGLKTTSIISQNM
jgi:hypothetical protein